MSDLTRVVREAWPATRRADDLDEDEVLAVLDQFDEYWPAALASLGPPENRSDGA